MAKILYKQKPAQARPAKKEDVVVNRDELEASVCKGSFYQFVRRFWDTIIPEEPVWNWHIKYLCNELQRVVKCVKHGRPKKYDLIINISPGSTKSTICSVMLPAWVWTIMPSAKLICGSYAHMLALELSRRSRLVVQSEKYRRLFPNIRMSEDQNTKGHFTTNSGGARIAVGTGGSITGFHAHIIIVDDPIDPNGAFSEADLQSANRWMRETLPTRKVNKATTPTILIMQRLHEEDPTGEWLERAAPGEVKHICLPADIEEGEDLIRPRELAENYVDGLMDPVRLPRQVLEENERTLGDYSYAGQFKQSPKPRGGNKIKADRILVDVPSNPMVAKVRYWDKAGTEATKKNPRPCYTVGLLLGRDSKGIFWILDVQRGRWDADQREAIILQTAKVDGIGVLIGVEQEPGSGGKESANNTLRNLAGFNVILDRPTGDKVLRSYPFAVQANGGFVRILEAPWTRDYLNEAGFFPHSKYKDQVDATSGAFAIMTNYTSTAGGLDL